MHLPLWRKGAVASWWWLQMNSEAIQPNPASIYHSDNPSSIYQSDIASPISQSNCPSFIFQSNSYIACSKIYQKIKTGSATFLSLFRQTQQRATQQESQIQNHSMQTALCTVHWQMETWYRDPAAAAYNTGPLQRNTKRMTTQLLLTISWFGWAGLLIVLCLTS